MGGGRQQLSAVASSLTPLDATAWRPRQNLPQQETATCQCYPFQGRWPGSDLYGWLDSGVGVGVGRLDPHRASREHRRADGISLINLPSDTRMRERCDRCFECPSATAREMREWPISEASSLLAHRSG